MTNVIEIHVRYRGSKFVPVPAADYHAISQTGIDDGGNNPRPRALLIRQLSMVALVTQGGVRTADQHQIFLFLFHPSRGTDNGGVATGEFLLTENMTSAQGFSNLSHHTPDLCAIGNEVVQTSAHQIALIQFRRHCHQSARESHGRTIDGRRWLYLAADDDE